MSTRLKLIVKNKKTENKKNSSVSIRRGRESNILIGTGSKHVNNKQDL